MVVVFGHPNSQLVSVESGLIVLDVGTYPLCYHMQSFPNDSNFHVDNTLTNLLFQETTSDVHKHALGTPPP